MLRFGVIGLGRIAQMTHLPHLYEFNDVEVSALCDASEQLLSKIAPRFPQATTYVSQKDMLAEAGLDAVVNCTVTTMHPSTVQMSLEAGIPTFVEKPLAFNPDDADMLSRLSSRKDKMLMVGYQRRFDSGYQRFKQALETEEEIFFVRAHKYFGGYGAVRDEIYHLVGGEVSPEISEQVGKELERQLAFLPGEWRAAYRIFTDIASHGINTLRGLWGDPNRIVHTEAWGARERAKGAGAIPHVVSMLEYDEHRAGFEFAFLPHKRFNDDEVVAYVPERILRLRFSNSAIQHSPAVLEVTSGVSEEQFVRVEGSHESPFRNILAHFVECVKDGGQPDTPAEDASRTVETGAAIIESARTGKPVTL
jgi:predicted dehydrogenase